MTRLLLRAAIGLVWIAATWFLEETQPSTHEPFRLVAAFVVSVPGLGFIWSGIGELLGRPRSETRDRVKRTLQSSVVQICQDRLYAGDITQLSFHVWVVPRWYRKLVPYSIRRRVKRDHRRMPMLLRPRLQRVAMYRIDHHQPSGISFRKGMGVVGRCIDLNPAGDVMHVRLDGNPFKEALRKGKEAWTAQDVKITQNLKFEHAETLATAYGQVAAHVIRETSGEAIGCVTLDLPPSAGLSLRRPAGRPLLGVLKSTAKHVETLLTNRAGDP